MNPHSYIKLTGELTVKKFNSNNELIQEIHVPNLVVTVGKQHVAERLINDSETKMSHMAIGQGLTAAAVANTALVNELGRVQLTVGSPSRSGSNVTYTAVFGAGTGTGSVTEAGIFNDDVTGTMLCRTTFPVIIKDAAETIAISWTVTVG